MADGEDLVVEVRHAVEGGAVLGGVQGEGGPARVEAGVGDYGVAGEEDAALGPGSDSNWPIR